MLNVDCVARASQATVGLRQGFFCAQKGRLAFTVNIEKQVLFEKAIFHCNSVFCWGVTSLRWAHEASICFLRFLKMFVYLRLTGLKMFPNFSWVSHRGASRTRWCGCWVASKCPIAKCHACMFPDYAAFFQGGGFKGQKITQLVYISWVRGDA